MVVVICVLRSGLVNSPFAPITNDQERTEVISGLFFVFVFLFFSFLFFFLLRRSVSIWKGELVTQPLPLQSTVSLCDFFLPC